MHNPHNFLLFIFVGYNVEIEGRAPLERPVGAGMPMKRFQCMMHHGEILNMEPIDLAKIIKINSHGAPRNFQRN